MSVILTNIHGFVEQVGLRRTHKAKTTDLDTMECVFVGPTSLEANAYPVDGTPHGEFPMMRSTGWNFARKEAGLSELQVSYVGKLWFGTPLVSAAWHQGSVSWTTYTQQVSKVLQAPWHTAGQWYNGFQIVAPANFPGAFSTSYLSISYVCYYMAATVTRSYLSMNPQGGGLESLGGPDPAVLGGVKNKIQYTTGCSLSDNRVGLVSATLEFIVKSEISASAIGNGWYEVSETISNVPQIVSSAFLS
jgi:hypothetical protein